MWWRGALRAVGVPSVFGARASDPSAAVQRRRAPRPHRRQLAPGHHQLSNYFFEQRTRKSSFCFLQWLLLHVVSVQVCSGNEQAARIFQAYVAHAHAAAKGRPPPPQLPEHQTSSSQGLSQQTGQ